MTKQRLRLGVNIDHVATIRNARGGIHPSPVAVALLAQKSGADGITIHLREDRRHISDQDVHEIITAIDIPLNFEMAATEEMLNIALAIKPNAVCIVPEKREELTTEGGLAVCQQEKRLKPIIDKLKDAGIRVSLFVDPIESELHSSAKLAADIVELHTGSYCALPAGKQRLAELARLATGAQLAKQMGLEVHAGHGISFETVKPIAALNEVVELNIGHFIIGESILTGLADVIKQMRVLMDQARG